MTKYGILCTLLLTLITSKAYSANNFIWLAYTNQYYHSCLAIVHKDTYKLKKTVCDKFWHIVDIEPHPYKDTCAVVDKHQKSLFYIDSDGEIIFQAGGDELSTFSSIYNVAIDPRSDHLYAMDTYRNWVVKFDSKGSVLDLIPGFSLNDGGFLGSELTFDPVHGQLWLANRFGTESQVHVFNAYGENKMVFTGLKTPYAVDVNMRNGNVFVSDKEHGYIFSDFYSYEQTNDLDYCLNDTCFETDETKKFYSQVTVNENKNTYWAIEGSNKIVEFDEFGKKLRTLEGLSWVTDIKFDAQKNILWASVGSRVEESRRRFYQIKDSAPDLYQVVGNSGEHHDSLKFDLPPIDNAGEGYDFYHPYRVEMVSPSYDTLPTYSVGGKVTGLEQATVEVKEFENIDSVETEDGIFKFDFNIPGKYVFEIKGECRSSVFKEVNISEKRSVQIPDVVLEKGHTTFDFEVYKHHFNAISGFEWGRPKKRVKCYSGRKCITTNLTGNYGQSANYNLYTPVFDIATMERPVLEFYTYYETDRTDGGNVNIVINGSLLPIIPEGGYPQGRVDALSGQGGFAGESNGWKKVTIDLTPYKFFPNTTFVFHFASTSNAVVNKGWFIDDVAVYDSTKNCK